MRQFEESDSRIDVSSGLSIHAEEVHSGLQHQTFTPFKDIWIPLDLSNAASFNAIMAHAAAHFFGRHGQDLDLSSLKYKTEAIALINKWLSNTTTALNDEVFAGVLRLLIFEVLYIPCIPFEINPILSLPITQSLLPYVTPSAD